MLLDVLKMVCWGPISWDKDASLLSRHAVLLASAQEVDLNQNCQGRTDSWNTKIKSLSVLFTALNNHLVAVGPSLMYLRFNSQLILKYLYLQIKELHYIGSFFVPKLITIYFFAIASSVRKCSCKYIHYLLLHTILDNTSMYSINAILFWFS